MNVVETDRSFNTVSGIYEIIRNRIALLEYAPGTKLSENTLAAEFGISRTPLRKVLQRLEFEHLLVRSQGSYTTVTDVDAKTLSQIYEVRMVLAENLYRFIDLPIPPATIKSLERLAEEAKELQSNHDVYLLGKIHREVEEALAGTISNIRAREITELLYFEISRIWLSCVHKLDWNEEIELLSSELRELIAVLQRGDLRGFGFRRRNQAAMAFDRIYKAISAK
ncbi:MAG: GntR family transcriptional regulator [Mesorhizobium sp.]|uniref:GntR family transcriptional regulator n=1 Tax=Mesorhizobium sp. TaxID=1871066 RepID=UPI000FE970B1|nr:GntR family transcriptional regulator [Mesorhizobium sp.]RWP83893.1 MAG: GntR family transcriptional regulator [Mesorhizobium sp.]